MPPPAMRTWFVFCYPTHVVMEHMNERDPARLILENLTTAVLLFDDALRLDYINPAGEILFDVSARHLLGQEAAQLWPGSHDFVQSLVASRESGHPYTEREVQLCLPSQKQVTVDLTVTPLRESPRGGALLLELLPMDRHLRIAREENLLDQYQTSRTLVRGLAHEIKNPLGGLRGAAQLLEQELPDDELREYTRIIIDEADRLQDLVNRMLGPKTLPRKRMINLHQVLERVRNLVQAELPPGIVIERDYDPSIPDLLADPDQLFQALLNIVRNAMQALGERGRITLATRTQRKVTLGHRLRRLVARIDIIDDGPGIPPDMINTIFYPMVTGRPEGTGLGLPIAQSLVNQHGGLIECSSRPGETVFSIILPLESE